MWHGKPCMLLAMWGFHGASGVTLWKVKRLEKLGISRIRHKRCIWESQKNSLQSPIPAVPSTPRGIPPEQLCLQISNNASHVPTNIYSSCFNFSQTASVVSEAGLEPPEGSNYEFTAWAVQIAGSKWGRKCSFQGKFPPAQIGFGGQPGTRSLGSGTGERQASRKGRRGRCPKERNEGKHSHLLLEHNQDFGFSLTCPSLCFLVSYREKSRRFSKQFCFWDSFCFKNKRHAQVKIEQTGPKPPFWEYL